MSGAMVALDKGDPRMVAWEKYKLTDDYANARKWAAYEEHVEGSLWGAFLVGYDQAQAQLAALAAVTAPEPGTV